MIYIGIFKLVQHSSRATSFIIPSSSNPIYFRNENSSENISYLEPENEAKNKALKGLQKEITEHEEYIKRVNKTYNKIINGIITGNESPEKSKLRRNISEKSIKIELNISPLCDYAQEKMPNVRLLPGLLIEKDLVETDDIIKHMLSDIQLRLGSHINRSGVIYVQ